MYKVLTCIMFAAKPCWKDSAKRNWWKPSVFGGAENQSRVSWRLCCKLNFIYWSGKYSMKDN